MYYQSLNILKLLLQDHNFKDTNISLIKQTFNFQELQKNWITKLAHVQWLLTVCNPLIPGIKSEHRNFVWCTKWFSEKTDRSIFYGSTHIVSDEQRWLQAKEVEDTWAEKFVNSALPRILFGFQYSMLSVCLLDTWDKHN